MTTIDYLILGFYLLFVLAIGLVFRRLSKNTSDYFRAGGAMPWWITGVSAWIASFSAWTFTGAAGKIYEAGTLVICLYWSGIIPTVIVMFYTSYRFRRMRVVTWMEAVRARYGKPTEQLYTWVKLPLLVIFSGVGLNAIAVFMSAVFDVSMTSMLIGLGVVVTLVAFAGGAWAVLASDFVQMLLVVSITLVTAYLALHQPAIGGLSGLITHVPSSRFHWTELAQAPILVLWAAALFWNALMGANNLENSSMYLMVKNDRDARRMVLIPLIGSLVGPLIWMIPPLTATITHPNLAAEPAYASMTQPAEAAFVAVAHDILPRGMIALLLCAMFGATLTSMDAALNKGVGVFVRSFYLPIVNPQCPEKKLLWIGKICTLVFGAIIVVIAIVVNRYRTVGLFDLTNYLAAALGTPMLIPLAAGIFYKRTPGWSGWSTVLVGFACSLALNRFFEPNWLARVFGLHTPLNKEEATYLIFAATLFTTSLVCTIYFFATTFFYGRVERGAAAAVQVAPVEYAPAAEHAPLEAARPIEPPQTEHERIEAFFRNMATPIVEARHEGTGPTQSQIMYRMIGVLCLVYGAFIFLLTLIPNPVWGRLCFVFCGSLVAGAGAILYWLYLRGSKAQTLANAAVGDALIS